MPWAASQTHSDEAQPSFGSTLQRWPAGQPASRHPSGEGPGHSPGPSGTQTPPPQSAVQTQVPFERSQSHSDGTQPSVGSSLQRWPTGQPVSWQPIDGSSPGQS